MHPTLVPLRRLSLGFLRFVALPCLLSCFVFAQKPQPEELEKALAKATDYLCLISTEGGYLWRYKPDLTQRAGEETATATQIWVQPPGTPAVGLSFLRAFEATGDVRHLKAARAAAMSLVRGQLESGGWDYLVEFDPAKRSRYAYRVDGGPVGKRLNTSTYDDDNTQSALRFLMAYVDAAAKAPADQRSPDDAKIREALDYGLEKLMQAQYPAGGWPQRWDGKPYDPAKYPVVKASYPESYPQTQPKSGYYGHYTLNDHTHRDAMLTLFEAHARLGKLEYLASARRAADFLILAQMPEPQPIWAQQYNSQLQPAWARAFEPPAVTSNESASAMLMLVQVFRFTGDIKYLEPLPAAIAWYRRSEVTPGRWARLNELKTNKPLYGDRDGKIHYTLEEITSERQTGYSWLGDYGIPQALELAEKALADAKAGKIKADPAAMAKLKEQPRWFRRGDVSGILASQDEQGRWLSRFPSRQLKGTQGPWVDMIVFSMNMNQLSAALQRAGKAPAKTFIDYFKPMPLQGPLTADTWGAPGVLPRDIRNGLEDAANRYCYWDGQILKGEDGKYRLFASRWDEPKGHNGWGGSVAVSAISDSLFGPYVDRGLCWPDNMGGKGHNVTALKLPDGRYAIVTSETRQGNVFVSDSLDGPWTFHGSIVTEGDVRKRASNYSVMVRPDGDFQIVPRSGQILISKSGILGPYKAQGPSIYPSITGLEQRDLEDPVVWFSGGRYHIVVNSWSQRRAFHLTSKDGITGWTLRGLAYDPRRDFVQYTDGTVNRWDKLERPGVVLENGHVVAVTLAVLDVPKDEEKGNDRHGNKIIVIPFDGAALDRDLADTPELPSESHAPSF